MEHRVCGRDTEAGAHAPGAGLVPGACARALLSPPSIPGAGGACDVRWFNPETAATADATEPRVRRWWALRGSQREKRDPETEASPCRNSGEWPLLGRGLWVDAWVAAYEGLAPLWDPALSSEDPMLSCLQWSTPRMAPQAFLREQGTPTLSIPPSVQESATPLNLILRAQIPSAFRTPAPNRIPCIRCHLQGHPHPPCF